MNRFLLVILGSILLVGIANGGIHTLQVQSDDRRYFLVENFGFLQNGLMNLTVHSFVADPPDEMGVDLFVTVAESDSTVVDPCDPPATVVSHKLADLSGTTDLCVELKDRNSFGVGGKSVSHLLFFLLSTHSPLVISRRIGSGADAFAEEGLYSVFVRNCQQAETSSEITLNVCAVFLLVRLSSLKGSDRWSFC
jgi:hypothetical protein